MGKGLPATAGLGIREGVWGFPDPPDPRPAVVSSLFPIPLSLLLPLGLATAQVAVAQPPSHWRLVDAIGYGALGAKLGFEAGSAMERSVDDTQANRVLFPPAFTLIGAFTGLVAGYATGQNADDMYANGRDLTTAHRVRVIGGALAAGATLGAVVAYQLRRENEGEDTPLGSHEQTTVILMTSGAALAGVGAWYFRHTLTGGRTAVMPLVTPQRLGMVISKPF